MIQQNEIDELKAKEAVEQFMALLEKVAPLLYEIELMNARFLKDMQHGEITITQFVKNGKIYRIEAIPKYSKIIAL